MAQSRPLDGGMAVPPESMAVASGAHDEGAAVISLGTGGTRPGDIATLLRPVPAKSTPLVFVSVAGPGGYGLARARTTTGHGGWGVAPAWSPQKTGDRVTTARREAIPLARRRRSGARTPGSVPAVQDAALRALSRAREETLHALTTATCRRTALRRHEIRSTGRAPGGPAPLRWRSAVGCPPPPSTASATQRAGQAPPTRRGSRAGHRPATSRAPPGGSARVVTRCTPAVACR
jgi:hypothetical protein